MFAYFIDDWVYSKNYSRELDKIDIRLTQQGISGRKIKLGRLHNLDESIKDSFASGVRTFVAIGNDKTVSRLLNTLIKLKNEKVSHFGVVDKSEKNNFVLGVVPVGEQNQIMSKCLGLNSIENSVSALVKHQTSVLDLGVLNKRHYFLTSAFFRDKVAIKFSSYEVSSLKAGSFIVVCNINYLFKDKDSNISATDGFLDAIIASEEESSLLGKIKSGQEKKLNAENIFSIKKIKISCRSKVVDVEADTIKRLSSPVTVEVVPAFAEFIVGEQKKI